MYTDDECEGQLNKKWSKENSKIEIPKKKKKNYRNG